VETPMDRPVCLSEMTWPEAKARLPKVKVAILPVGSAEQHGPHLTFETDIAIAAALARRLALQQFPAALVAPPLPVGMSNHHMRFPGTITWRHETFRAAVADTVASLRAHGVPRFLILNGHGGNRAALSILASQLRYEHDVIVACCTWFELVRDVCRKFIPGRRVHADEIEAAMGLYLAPRIVRQKQLAAGKAHADPYPYTDPGSGGGIEVPYRWDELTPNGAYGDARRATVAMGQELTEAFLKRAGEFLNAFMGQKSRRTRK
ncbi:MAG TPA: creatininase family protein, partial [Candidatus Baltobacteraceae bacterium]|nr:creatininase family protein [Candidatus Baltobacteraceae bacterium]